VDLSALPTRALLRWELAVRLLLAVAVPVAVEQWRTGSVTGTSIAAALVAALVALACLGPEARRVPWLAMAAVGTPLAVLAGALVGPSRTGGTLLVFVLYLMLGAMTRAGLVSQLAWSPVATAGLLASVLVTDSADIPALAAAVVMGAAWSVLLIVVVPLVVRAPRLPVPPEALDVDTDMLRRMVRHPAGADWVYPLLLGGLAAAMLVVVDVLTGGFKPYWAVFALVGVLSPTTAATRKSSVQTVGSTLAGILLAAALLSLGLSELTIAVVAMVLGLVGALLLLRSGTFSKVLMTPLPVIMAAAALGPEGSLALSLRLVEYLLGAGVGFAAAVGGEWLSRRLSKDRPPEQAEIAT
jgi:hypothetical protein